MRKCKIKPKQTLVSADLFVIYKIKSISRELNYKYSRRLSEMGFTENEQVQVIRKSLFQKTFLVAIRGFIISLRKEIAEAVEVTL